MEHPKIERTSHPNRKSLLRLGVIWKTALTCLGAVVLVADGRISNVMVTAPSVQRTLEWQSCTCNCNW